VSELRFADGTRKWSIEGSFPASEGDAV
jgi:hypothetical protein